MKNKLVHPLFQVSRMMSQRLNQELTIHGLTHMQLAIIEFLNIRAQSTSLVDIAKYLSVEKSTVTRTVKQLEVMNLVQHVPSEDSREKRIILSDNFPIVQNQIQETKKAFEDMVFHNISLEETDRIYSAILKIMNNLKGED